MKLTISKRVNGKPRGSALIMVIGVAVVGVWAINRELRAARYPGAVPISRYTDYGIRSDSLRLENAYRTSDPIRAVYDWYLARFDLTPAGESGEAFSTISHCRSRFARSSAVRPPGQSTVNQVNRFEGL